MRVLLSVPTTGMIHAESAHCLMELSHDMALLEPEIETIICMLPRMMIAQAREEAVNQALKLGCDYIFFIDDDMIPNRGIFQTLLKHGKDIVGGMSFERLGEHNPNIYASSHVETHKDGEHIVGSMKYANILNYDEERDEAGLLEVDAIGFGCALIKTSVFEEMDAPWFMSQFQIGEDIFFCYKAKEKGYKVYMDCSPEGQLGHLSPPAVINEELHKFVRRNKDRKAMEMIKAAAG